MNTNLHISSGKRLVDRDHKPHYEGNTKAGRE